jgi:hypothetical protein
LSLTEITAGILSIATAKPGFAGIGVKLLKDLRPVGGAAAGFHGCPTFGQAMEAVLGNSAVADTLREIRVSESEIYTNGHCRALIEYVRNGNAHAAHYVSPLALSLLQSGAEKTFNRRELTSSVITETVFYPAFFKTIQDSMDSNVGTTVSAYDLGEEHEEAGREDRARRLGITTRSRFLNIGVDNQVTWPPTETVVAFHGYKLVLMPKTREHTTSIHIDLSGQSISAEDALTLANQFLSLLTWCDDQFAVLQDGWSGTPIPVPVPKRDLAFTTAHQWIFDRKIPQSAEARKAIAIYRDGRNAEQNYLVSYAVLCYYKIVEVKHRSTGDAKRWFRDQLQVLRDEGAIAEKLTEFDQMRGDKPAHEYLYQTCRSAVAHANKPLFGDSDDYFELRRLHLAARILRVLARRFIKAELGISDCIFDGS